LITLNHHYHDDATLRNWLKENNLVDEVQCLVQFFCGQPEETTMQHITSVLVRELPLAHIIGTTTDGEILGNRVLLESIVISCSVFEKSTLRSNQKSYHKDSYALGKVLCSELNDEELKAIIFFTAGVELNHEEFLSGVRSVSQGRFIIAGGMAGDNGHFSTTYVTHNTTILNNGAVAVAVYGSQLQVTNRYQLGWKPIGFPMKVTKAIGNRIYEINNRSALSVYEKYLSEPIANELPKIGVEFPLIVERDGVILARACLQKFDDGSLLFAGNIYVGEMVRFGIGEIYTILEESKKLCAHLKNSFQPDSIFVYSCMARRRLLKNSSLFEIQKLASHCSVSGFYTYGEFFSDEKANYIMNETITILALSESCTTKDLSLSLEEQINPSSPDLLVQALTYMTNVMAREWEERLDEEIEKNRKKELNDFQNAKLIQMGELVSMIAHQWRQPLNALSANAIHLSLLSDMEMLEPQHVQESSHFIQEQCQKMSQTIDTFINFVKPTKESCPFALRHTLEAIMHIVGSQMSNHTIDIIFQRLDDIVIDGYEDLLEQVLLNLISNAKDAFATQKIEDKKIIFNITTKDGIPKIIMEDNAGGIAEDAREKIFNPYFTTKEPGKGTGIGLYMSIAIMRQSFNGDLQYTPLPHGSRFELILKNQKEENE